MSLYELFFRCVTLSYPSVDGAANYALMRDGDALYIFFEGSNGEEDWRVNLDFPARAYKRGAKTVWYAHRGFVDLWKTTEPYVSGALLDPSVKSITVVGYSHGGAIATLCHEYVWFNRPDLRHNVTGYGFGAPRVLWGAPTRYLAQRWQGFTVVRNLDDAVTHLPPKLLGYSHVGNLLEIGEASRYSPIDAHRAENILYQLKIYESGI